MHVYVHTMQQTAGKLSPHSHVSGTNHGKTLACAFQGALSVHAELFSQEASFSARPAPRSGRHPPHTRSQSRCYNARLVSVQIPPD